MNNEDRIEAHLSEDERRIYREDKAVSALMRNACDTDAGVSRVAMQALRRVFYEKKRTLEVLQRVPEGQRNYAELGRVSNLCRSIVALFNDQGWGLHERKAQPRGALTRGDTNIIMGKCKRPRTYQGLE